MKAISADVLFIALHNQLISSNFIQTAIKSVNDPLLDEEDVLTFVKTDVAYADGWKRSKKTSEDNHIRLHPLPLKGSLP